MDFVILQSFDNYIEAHMVMGRLEAAGINCWLKDENIVTIDPILTNAVGGIKLMVLIDQQEEAIQILQLLQQQQKEYFICPTCGSNNIEFINSPRKAINWFSAVITWLAGNYAIAVEQAWHCFNCKTEFKVPLESRINENPDE